MKPHISSILKKGAKLNAFILDTDDAKIKKLIDETVKQQEAVLALKNIPDEFYRQRITI